MSLLYHILLQILITSPEEIKQWKGQILITSPEEIKQWKGHHLATGR
jgi:hypothetical protein